MIDVIVFPAVDLSMHHMCNVSAVSSTNRDLSGIERTALLLSFTL